MNKIKATIVYLIAVLFLIGCANLGIKISDESATILEKSATSTVGYLIAKNNPKYIDEMIKWYTLFNNAEDINTVQEAFQEGVTKLSKLISDDPYLQLQVKNLSELIQISYDGPQVPEEITKYKHIVDSFMDGVMIAKGNFT